MQERALAIEYAKISGKWYMGSCKYMQLGKIEKQLASSHTGSTIEFGASVAGISSFKCKHASRKWLIEISYSDELISERLRWSSLAIMPYLYSEKCPL